MYDIVKHHIDAAKNIVVIQPENPDADSLGTSLALEEILSEQDKHVSLFCAIEMPKYLRYIEGGSRVSSEWTGKYDLAIIVDTSAEALLIKALETPSVRHFLDTHPVIVFDHHIESDEGDNSLPFPHELVLDAEAASTSELIFQVARTLNWSISTSAAESMLISTLGDTLGLTTPSVTATTFQVATELVKLGASPSEIDKRRREYMKKPADILAYKGELIKRIEYSLDGKLATVHIPWEEIQQYSDRYNPSVLVLDEMRLVEEVEIAIAIKTYPDGKLTGKIRSNIPIADKVAGFFGGGGHAYAAGFKIHEEYDTACRELISATDKILQDYNHETHK